MNDHETKKIEELFRAASRDLSGPSPYLKTRVLARLREKKSKSLLSRWKWFAILSTACSLLLLAGFFLHTRSDFSAQLGQPVLVKVEMENIKDSQIAFAEIVLPEGVHFYSSQFPEMNDKRSLTLSWNPSLANGKLPFVVKSTVSGGRQIHVLLKGADNQVLGDKILRIDFKG